MSDQITDSKNSRIAITILRILVGWHFLYEGIIKIYNPDWSAKGYLLTAETFTGFYQWLASDSLIGLVDAMNVVVLLLVGLSLVLGIFEKQGAFCGIGLLLLYYFAHPAFMGSAQLVTEGNYWIINKNLVEAAALFVLYTIPTGSYFGLEVLFKKPSELKTA